MLIALSLSVVGALGLWFATFPAYQAVEIIFIGWGLAAGLTFWAALLKGVKMLAAANEQGRFFGILDGGRGLVEAVLASIALGIFAFCAEQGGEAKLALCQVINMYSFTCLGIAVLILLFLDKGVAERGGRVVHQNSVLADLRLLLAIPQIWLLALIILCGYQLFWATYSFSAYLQQGYGMTAVAAGFITVTKLWMRPIGGIGGGFLGDRFSKEGVLGLSMLFSSLSLFGLVFFPGSAGVYFLLALVLLLGVLTYAIRGLYWSLLDACKVPLSVTGLAIGLISVIGYLPDIFLPMINAAFAVHYPGIDGYRFYFAYIAVCGLLGSVAVFYFKQLNKQRESV